MAESKAVLRAAIMKVVNNQLAQNDPPATRVTFERLKGSMGEAEAKRLIGVVVAKEIFDVLKEGRMFDEEQFVATLERLPELPSEGEKSGSIGRSRLVPKKRRRR